MLRIHDISKSYGEVTALDKVDFEVSKGELFGLIGPDGSGKTTLFRIITTLLLPDKGTVHMDGKDVAEEVDFVRRNVGYMPGKFSLYQDLTVRENLNFFATIFNTTVEENRYLIEDIYRQIEPFDNRKAGALSGGMKQKLALCCALIHKPRLLLLDEPTTGVDAVSRKEFWQMLQKLRDDGITILASTPYMDESRLCDRVALIQDGRIMGVDSPEAIIGQFDKKLFRISGENLYPLLNEIRSRPEIDQVYPFGQSLHVYADTDVQSILSELRPQGELMVETANPDIEDCFMNLMSKAGES